MPYAHSHGESGFIYIHAFLSCECDATQQVLEIELIIFYFFLFFFLGGGLYSVQGTISSSLPCPSLSLFKCCGCECASLLCEPHGVFSVPSHQHSCCYRLQTGPTKGQHHYTQLFNFRVQWNPKGPPSQGWNLESWTRTEKARVFQWGWGWGVVSRPK